MVICQEGIPDRQLGKVQDYTDELGLTLPIVCKEQLLPYKQYLLLVSFFIDYFRKNGVPKKEALGTDVLALAETALAPLLRKVAVEEAIDAFRGPSIGLSVK